MRFYAACLASYNNGRLHGVWVDASDDIDAMQDAINAMLRASPFPNVKVKHPETGEFVPSAEEWAIHDHEGFGKLEEYTGLAEIVEIFAINEVAEEHDIPLAVLREAMSDANASDAESFISDNYRGKYDSWQSFAEEFIPECHDLSGIPDWLQGRIDWAGIGHDLEVSGDFSGIRHADDYSLYIFWNH
ncbi:antirestriction protein ArdA [Bradyrhizobium sp. SZCCHNR2026]|uniref:antirestriction protein ArdA n=1 Tax=Bradyrhizobium sp. SZCCHNR2026 TaxID=3057381 RepID=UPI002916473A|nr:antirestriction protein ArdA [Bradyrhizobium sp. SZCCHNR2026]